MSQRILVFIFQGDEKNKNFITYFFVKIYDNSKTNVSFYHNIKSLLSNTLFVLYKNNRLRFLQEMIEFPDVII